MLSFALAWSIFPTVAMAAPGEDRSIDNEVYYKVAGTIDAGIRYWSVEYDSIDTDGSILLRTSKWAERSNQWGTSATDPYAGKFLINFHRVEFYEQIQSISVINGGTVTEFDKEANGALWTVPITAATFSSGLIGVVTNEQIRIRLKDQKTLADLGLEDTPISFNTLAVTGSGNPGGKSGFIANGSQDQSYILVSNPNQKNEKDTTFTRDICLIV